MSINRIQKLLFSEYCDFEDMVLVESPFAQTTREGKGIRQVNLGLTPTKLVLATDVLPSAKEATVTYIPGIDPDIETFELVAVYPVECLNLSVFHRRKRQSLKARFCNNRILYFELGGFEKRRMFWNLWCERVKFLSPEDPESSHSETSVGTSTSNSTLYLLATKKVVNNAGVPQLWCKFGAGDMSVDTAVPKWTDRYLYLGRNIDEPPTNYYPTMLPPTASQFLIAQPSIARSFLSNHYSHSTSLLIKSSSESDKPFGTINRFGSGVPDGCISGLFLPAENFIMQRKISLESSQTGEGSTLYAIIKPQQKQNFAELSESGVRRWELSRDDNLVVQRGRGRHRRRYGFSPQPHFMHGLGPWSVPLGERFSVQVKRAVSAVRIRRQPQESELKLPISRRQLVASISCEALHLDNKLNYSSNTIKTPLKRPVIFFWTPEYWYRPCSAKEAYQELFTHLNKIRSYCQSKHKFSKKGAKRKFFKNKYSKVAKTDTSELSEDFRKYTSCTNTKKQRCAISRRLGPLKGNIDQGSYTETVKQQEETSLQYLRRILRMEIALTAWDFDSTTLACQITLIDRDLFLKIPTSELGVLLWQQTSKNTPNIGALEAFSHRISCLVATEVLKDDSDKIRARLIARLINTAEKCHKISNFQSCKSILCGLQSPAIYRLYNTWMYVRKRHATKYQVFETLCRLYRDPRLPAYQKAFFRASQERPYLPYLGDLIAKLLGRVITLDSSSSLTTCSDVPKDSSDDKTTPYNKCNRENSNTCSTKPRKPTMIKKFLSTLHLIPSLEENHMEIQIERKTASNCDTSVTFCEDDRSIRLTKIIEFLERCQRAAACYDIKNNDLARDYILKARYKEDRENFLNSFNVEKQYFVRSGYYY